MTVPAPSRLTILTGASRGLGRAMAAQCLARGDHLVAIARRPDASLELVAREHGARLESWAVDLADPSEADRLLGAFLADVGSRGAASRPTRVALVHNAALLTEPGPIDDVASGELAAAMRVGLEAPVRLTATFLRHTRAWGGDRRVLFISSGLGRRPMAGSAPYCAIKAGLDHFARALALDEQLAGGAKVVSLAPGIIDTDMQVTLRSADRERFP